jgi:ferredoxin
MEEKKKKCTGCQNCESHCGDKIIEEFEETAVDPKRIADWLGWELTEKKKDEITVEYSIVSRKTHPRVELIFHPTRKTLDRYYIFVFTSINKKYLSTTLTFANAEKVKYTKYERAENEKTREFKAVQIYNARGEIFLSDIEPRRIVVWSN